MTCDSWLLQWLTYCTAHVHPIILQVTTMEHQDTTEYFIILSTLSDSMRARIEWLLYSSRCTINKIVTYSLLLNTFFLFRSYVILLRKPYHISLKLPNHFLSVYPQIFLPLPLTPYIYLYPTTFLLFVCIHWSSLISTSGFEKSYRYVLISGQETVEHVSSVPLSLCHYFLVPGAFITRYRNKSECILTPTGWEERK